MLVGHTKQVYRVAFDPDGKTLASVGYDGKVKVWDAATGRDAGSLDAPVSGNAGLAFVPHLPGSWVAVSGQGGQVRLWDPTNLKQGTAFQPAQGNLGSLAANPIRPLLAAGSEEGGVYVWNSVSGLLLKSLILPADGVTDKNIAVAFSPDGAMLAAGNDAMVKVWDVADYKERWSAPTPAAGLTAFTADGKTLVTASHYAAAGASHVVRRWRAEDGAARAPPLLIDEGHAWGHWALNPDGKELVGRQSSIDG